MSTQRTQAEALALSLELGLLDVTDAVAWADVEIAASDTPHNALCEVALASRDNNLDVANMLRQLPGEIDCNLVLRGVIRNAAEVLRSNRRTPEQIAAALYKLAIDGNLPSGGLCDHAWWFDNALDLAESGYIQERPEQVVNQMHEVLDAWLDDETVG
jgi:hypothetical protein